MSFFQLTQYFRGVARIFQRGDHSRDTIQGSPTIDGLYRCSPSCISGLSRIIAAWRPILTKDKSRWQKYFQKNKFLKSGLFNNGIFYGQDIIMAFSPAEYCRLFAEKKAYQGGSRSPQDPPSYAPVYFGVGETHHWWLLFQVAATWPIWRIMQIEQGIIHWGFR